MIYPNYTLYFIINRDTHEIIAKGAELSDLMIDTRDRRFEEEGITEGGYLVCSNPDGCSGNLSCREEIKKYIDLNSPKKEFDGVTKKALYYCDHMSAAFYEWLINHGCMDSDLFVCDLKQKFIEFASDNSDDYLIYGDSVYEFICETNGVIRELMLTNYKRHNIGTYIPYKYDRQNQKIDSCKSQCLVPEFLRYWYNDDIRLVSNIFTRYTSSINRDSYTLDKKDPMWKYDKAHEIEGTPRHVAIHPFWLDFVHL